MTMEKNELYLKGDLKQAVDDGLINVLTLPLINKAK